ncbi:MAG TPA: DMT family transporter [Xanthobacteraceae bacterium]|nr:DMT family transporter [Xanthobacteraceae bacterium]
MARRVAGPIWLSPNIIGILCGTGAAFAWAIGFVAARHGIQAGLHPADIAFHRYAWAGFFLLPFVLHDGLKTLGGVGWGRSLALTVLGGPTMAILSYSGFLTAPLGHGAVIQPSTAMLGGLLLAWLVLGEILPASRVIGALAIVAGLTVLAGEAAFTIGAHGILGDLSFAAAGLSWAGFGLLLALWRIDALRAVGVVSALALLVYAPLHALLFGFGGMIAAGYGENLLQIVVQGGLAGAGAVYLYARAVNALGAGRAAVFPALVPGFTMLAGFLILGEIPSLAQLVGLAIVAIGFRFAMKS